MQGALRPLTDLFNGDDACLVIPVYQRNYDWEIEQCARLFDDIVTLGHKNNERRTSGNYDLLTHFVGSIVYKNEGAIGESTIIDGQQRLTTVSLIYCALHDWLIEQEDSSSQDRKLAERIENNYLRSEYAANGQKMKLKPVKTDASAYKKILSHSPELDESSQVTANYRYFRKRVAKAELPPQQLFDTLRQLQVMRLALEPSDNAQLIFESLNSTGLDLSKADLIRNWVLMGLKPEEQEYLYERYWNPIEVDTNFKTTEFLRHFLTAQLGRVPVLDRLYEEFKQWATAKATTHDPVQDMNTVLSLMRSFAGYYHQLREANTSDPATDRVLKQFNLVDHTVAYPFLMLIMNDVDRGLIDSKQLTAIIRTVDTYLARRFVCQLPTNSLNKAFALMHRNAAKLVDQGATWSEAVIFQLVNRTGSAGSAEFPDDIQFVEALKTRDFYKIASQQRNYFWDALENGNSKDTRDIAYALIEGDVSIEHIMPQTISDTWRQALGPDADAIHAVWVNRLGNLTVTGYNSSYSNASFISKRDREDGFASSPYRINQALKYRDTWDAQAIKERTEELIQRALKRWPMPTTTFEPPAPVEDIEPMGDDTDFTGKKILAWEMGGALHRVTTWKAMQVGVLEQLKDNDPAGFYRLASDKTIERVWTKESGHPTNRYSIGLTGGMQVQSGGSTSMRTHVLRQIFDFLGVSTDDLIFHLKPDSSGESEE